MDTRAIVKQIMLEATQEDLAWILDACKGRRNTLGEANSYAVKVGDKVELHSISPKYMTGVQGVVTAKKSKRLVVEFDHPLENYRYGRFQGAKSLTVPASCVRVVE